MTEAAVYVPPLRAWMPLALNATRVAKPVKAVCAPLESGIALLIGDVAEEREGVASKVTVKVPVSTGSAVFCPVVLAVRHWPWTGLPISVPIGVCVGLPLVPVMIRVLLPVGVV